MSKGDGYVRLKGSVAVLSHMGLNPTMRAVHVMSLLHRLSARSVINNNTDNKTKQTTIKQPIKKTKNSKHKIFNKQHISRHIYI